MLRVKVRGGSRVQLAVNKNKFEVHFDFDGEKVWVDYKDNEWQRDVWINPDSHATCLTIIATVGPVTYVNLRCTRKPSLQQSLNIEVGTQCVG